MTPKEKAEELTRKYYTWGINKQGQTLSWLESKQCALIAVDEILSLSKIASIRRDEVYMELEYWIEVKQEIVNL